MRAVSFSAFFRACFFFFLKVGFIKSVFDEKANKKMLWGCLFFRRDKIRLAIKWEIRFF